MSEAVFEKLGIDKPKATRIINPQHKELVLMRPTLMTSLAEAVKLNFDRGNGPDIRLFEIATVFGPEKGSKLCEEELALGIALSGARELKWIEPGRPHSVFDLKGLIEGLLRSAGAGSVLFQETESPFLAEALLVNVSGKQVGIFGKASAKLREFFDVEDEIYLGEVILSRLVPLVSTAKLFEGLSKYPSSKRDLALVLSEGISAKEVIDAAAAVCSDLIRKVDVIDLYRGKQIPSNCKSLALSIEYRADDRTLTAEEISSAHAKVVETVTGKFGATLRS